MPKFSLNTTAPDKILKRFDGRRRVGLQCVQQKITKVHGQWIKPTICENAAKLSGAPRPKNPFKVSIIACNLVHVAYNRSFLFCYTRNSEYSRQERSVEKRVGRRRRRRNYMLYTRVRDPRERLETGKQRITLIIKHV